MACFAGLYCFCSEMHCSHSGMLFMSHFAWRSKQLMQSSLFPTSTNRFLIVNFSPHLFFWY
jgi:hypothetical protein